MEEYGTCPRCRMYLKLNAKQCPACGANIALPSEGNRTECSYCGSAVFAVDIFEKIRELISSASGSSD